MTTGSTAANDAAMATPKRTPRRVGTALLCVLLIGLGAPPQPRHLTPATLATASQPATPAPASAPPLAASATSTAEIPKAAPAPAPAASSTEPSAKIATGTPTPAVSNGGPASLASAAAVPATAASTAAITPSLDDIEHRTFEFFWQTANPQNGLVPDHWPQLPGKPYFASIAAVGFALTAYPIGVQRGWITREQARQRVLATLKFFADAPEGTSEDDDTGYHGFFYHFLDMQTGHRYARWVEVSTIDTTLLMAGVLFDETYFDEDNPQEREIRKLADQLYRNVDWTWAQARPPLVSMGWTPGGKFIPYDWQGYDEAMILYVLALGSPSHAVGSDAWKAWASTYGRTWGSFMGGKPHIGFAPLFGHQYSEAWIDFRGIQDAFMRAHGLTYFQNSRRAVVGQRAYAIANPQHHIGYGADIWGLTACNGPGHIAFLGAKGEKMFFYGYLARGADVRRIIDDGTVAPTAAIASIVFAPQLVLPTIQAMYQRYGRWLYSEYGFFDAFNPSFRLSNAPIRTGRVVPDEGWFDNEYLGIDQGPILLMIENYRSGFVWKVMRRNPYIRKGLERAGFTGGWLAAKPGAPPASAQSTAPASASSSVPASASSSAPASASSSAPASASSSVPASASSSAPASASSSAPASASSSAPASASSSVPASASSAVPASASSSVPASASSAVPASASSSVPANASSSAPASAQSSALTTRRVVGNAAFRENLYTAIPGRRQLHWR